MAAEADSPLEVLHAAHARSGMTWQRFAEDVISRDDRTVRRWRDGTVPIPAVVLRKLRRYIEESRP